MTTTEPATVVLAHLPTGQPIDLFSAFGDLLSAALDGAMLAPGTHPAVNAEIHGPAGMTAREMADRLRHAAGAVRGVEYVPQPRPDEEPDLTTGRMRLDDDGKLSFGLGGPQEVYEQAAVFLIDAFRPALDDRGATNYLEFNAEDPATRRIPDVPGTGEQYTLIVCRPDGKTPHQLRREAEAEVEQFRAQRSAALALADEWDAQYGDTNVSRRLREALGVEA